MREKRVRQLINDNNVKIVRKSSRSIYGKIIYYILGVVIALTFLFPLIYMLACSTKSHETIAQQASAEGAGKLLLFLPDITNFGQIFENYKILFGQYNLGRYALNSFLYAAIVIVLNIVVNGLAAYAIAKLRFPGKRFFNFIIMFLIIVPVETSIIPLYWVCLEVFLKNNISIFAVILPASISIFNIFLFIQFFSSIPKEFEEAARMDGANTLQVFLKVILPLSKPILATVSVFCFIGVWNDYLWPTMILTNQDMWPVQAGLESIANSNPDEGQKMASLVFASIPIFIVYVLAQKYIVKGFGAGGLKI